MAKKKQSRISRQGKSNIAAANASRPWRGKVSYYSNRTGKKLKKSQVKNPRTGKFRGGIRIKGRGGRTLITVADG